MHLRFKNSDSYTSSIVTILPSAGANTRFLSALIFRGGLRKKRTIQQKRTISVIPKIVLQERLHAVTSVIIKNKTNKIINVESITGHPSLCIFICLF